MAIQFTCPSCEKPLEAPDELAGRRGTCPQCNQPVDVPEPPAGTASSA